MEIESTQAKMPGLPWLSLALTNSGVPALEMLAEVTPAGIRLQQTIRLEHQTWAEVSFSVCMEWVVPVSHRSQPVV